MIRRLLDTVTPRQRVDSEAVRRAYQLIFRRDPENDDVVHEHVLAHEDVWTLLASLMDSPEFGRSGLAEPRTTLNWQPLIERYKQHHLEHRPGFIVNYLGVPTRISFLGHLKGSAGFVEGTPWRGDFHSSVAEWIAGLRGVELAGDHFVAVELGAGWGPWMVNLCQAAKIKGARRTFAIGCEADEQHCQFLHQHLADNGYSTSDYRLFEGAIGSEKGLTLFPISDDSAHDWGLRPIFCKSEAEADEITSGAHSDYRGRQFRFHRVPCFTLQEVLAGIDHVDVLHVDIQGGEVELVRNNLELLRRRVRYLVIGTHGRQIEGELIAVLRSAGWQLEVEEPCAFDICHPGLEPQVDGTQGWRNLEFAN